MLLVDTNVLVDVLEDDPEWADWSTHQLRAQSKIHRLAINPIIYAELSLTFSTVEALDQALDDLGLVMIETPRPALFLAGKAFVRYRRQGGTKINVLGDFLRVWIFLATKDRRQIKAWGHKGLGEEVSRVVCNRLRGDYVPPQETPSYGSIHKRHVF